MEKTFVNREKLKEKMAEKELNLSDMANILEISRSAISRKITKQIRFSEDEVAQLVKLFGRQILNL